MTIALRTGRPGSALAVIILIGIILYIAVAVGFSGYLISQAFIHTPTDFDKAAVGALIAVIGTGLTSLGALYTANRQAAVAQQIEFLRSESAKELAQVSARLTSDLDKMKAQSAESLERLKTSLDVSKTAYRELFGAATTYFYALRSIALGQWDEESLKKAEALMIETTRHLIYVSDEMRDDWLSLWQDAQRIYRNALDEPVVTNRPALVQTLIMQASQVGRAKLNLREKHFELEKTAKSATLSGMTPNS